MSSAGDVSLADRIRQRLDAGTLPRTHPEKIWVGLSSGEEICNACGDRIFGAQATYEADVDGVTCRFHGGCYGLWLGQLILRGLYQPK
jgi:hypothetical protein